MPADELFVLNEAESGTGLGPLTARLRVPNPRVTPCLILALMLLTLTLCALLCVSALFESEPDSSESGGVGRALRLRADRSTPSRVEKEYSCARGLDGTGDPEADVEAELEVEEVEVEETTEEKLLSAAACVRAGRRAFLGGRPGGEAGRDDEEEIELAEVGEGGTAVSGVGGVNVTLGGSMVRVWV